MSYKQVRSFNTDKGGSRPGYCLMNVRQGFAIAAKYPTAWDAWKNTQKHSGRPPAGVDVPVFFSYHTEIDGINKNWGHIGVRLADGRFWSDGRIYSSIKTYTDNYAPDYVGWGESVNGVRVIKENDMYKGKTAQYWNHHAIRLHKQRDEWKKEAERLKKAKSEIEKLYDEQAKIVDKIQSELKIARSTHAAEKDKALERADKLSAKVSELQAKIVRLEAEAQEEGAPGKAQPLTWQRVIQFVLNKFRR